MRISPNICFSMITWVVLCKTLYINVPMCSRLEGSSSNRMSWSVYLVLLTFLPQCVIKCWFCVEADETTCLLEKEEDTCTDKVLAYFLCYWYPFFTGISPLLALGCSCVTEWNRQELCIINEEDGCSCMCLTWVRLLYRSQRTELLTSACCEDVRLSHECICHLCCIRVFQLTPPTFGACCMRHLFW